MSEPKKCQACGRAFTVLANDEYLARARSDLVEEAKTIHAKAMLGQLNERTAETQRKAALDVLSGDWLKHLSDEALLAEIERREKAQPTKRVSAKEPVSALPRAKRSAQ